ncbi:3-oxoacyl-[acyl-carrier-protein] synthase III C-terminal domain-containing protein [Paenibacillus sp. PCH8]|uniref:3-oxoacyl-[acyl-carrier-protein] synthase III C-terminal domain-containing protein n=1 Tax=Paenibacillus sp. PCH8 TaxID=2066524 RepID=UPI0015E2FECB
MEKTGLTLQDIQYIVPHNVNLSSWKKVATRLSYPLERVYTSNVKEIGHCFCSDPYINLQAILEQKLMQPGIIMCLLRSDLELHSVSQ